ncbi:hypothetical protein LZX53_002178 [Salmonella enterica]|uniref:hypothetical protein n=1 Tax=Salmonella enterica TaxID=28901 RepID=UPI000D565C7C|nr:hypothetical protein [Salmonella enterica]ECS8495103.1 hypothetical protein [Salmonella enterica subsp. enterica serovar Give]EBN6094407.1 hypothetical protein [Salmonella enterica]EBQ6498302.1 hypothetical protein [Salmonella enterica]EDY8706411.1 hypothetical protein [Salmonella enterica]EFQ9162062.1 hypothetical protein [Salmonella enterica]
MYYKIIKPEKDKLKEKYQPYDILDLLKKYDTDKQKRDYYTILDELLTPVPLSKQIEFINEWKDNIPRLSNDYPEPDGLWWSRTVRRGEFMIEEAINLHFWYSFVSEENLPLVKNYLPQDKIDKFKNNENITHIDLWDLLNND